MSIKAAETSMLLKSDAMGREVRSGIKCGGGTGGLTKESDNFTRVGGVEWSVSCVARGAWRVVLGAWCLGRPPQQKMISPLITPTNDFTTHSNASQGKERTKTTTVTNGGAKVKGKAPFARGGVARCEKPAHRTTEPPYYHTILPSIGGVANNTTPTFDHELQP